MKFHSIDGRIYRTDTSTVLAADPYCGLEEDDHTDLRYDTWYYQPARYLLKTCDGDFFIQYEYSDAAMEEQKRSPNRMFWRWEEIESVSADEAVNLYSRFQEKHCDFDSAFATNAYVNSTLDELPTSIDTEVAMMKDVATGGSDINSVSGEYKRRRREIQGQLASLGVHDPNPYQDLWEWYAHWKDHLPSYQSRRTYLDELYRPLYDALANYQSARLDPALPGANQTGWREVDFEVDSLRRELASAHETRAFQAIGVRCRDLLLTLIDACYESNLHGNAGNGANEKFEAIVNFHAGGSSNEELRRLIKSAFAYANAVQHGRSMTLVQAQIAAEATVSVVRLIRLLVSTEREDTQ